MTMTTTMMIEASSPLAAMQHPPFMSRCGRFVQEPYVPFARTNFGPNSFNFRDLSMLNARQQMDYFNMPPPMRGSSPTASLAADLSQNMNIDRSSPQYPTPRRALFGNNLFNPYRAHVTTPPVSSSSPGPTPDSMELSPLPHKPVRASYEQLQSPSPEPTPIEVFSTEELTPQASSPVQMEEIVLSIPERRRSGQLRPGLTRTKGYSTNSIPTKPNFEAQPPAFKFCTGPPRPRPQSSLNLSEYFDNSSPVAERTAPSIASPLAPPTRVRQPFNVGHSSRLNSPMGHARKVSVSANPLVRPRKQFRRSLSMFEHPDEVMQREKDSCVPVLPPIVDMEAPHDPQLPHFYSDNATCDLPRITKETMVNILDGKFDSLYDKRVVIDCRFEYEYAAGHIAGAVNYNDKEQLASQLFDVEEANVSGKKALLIFHCEYSVHRAPLMAAHVRNKDRSINMEHYPRLSYPEAYVLEGGFSSFYRAHANHCIGDYVEMGAKEHADACEAGMDKVKHQQRAKLTRAQTFAFGTALVTQGFDSSPTSTIRCRGTRDAEDIDMDDSLEFTPVAPRPSLGQLQFGRNQRMFSY